MINIQPTLIGKLVKIRPLKLQDLEGLTKASSDPLVWVQHPQPRRYEREYFLQKFFYPALDCKGAFAFENKNNQIIGSSRYYDHRPHLSQINIGYSFIEKKYWGSTYNNEIKHLMLNHIFQFVDSALFTVGVNNIRSQTAMQRIGGKKLSEDQVSKREIPYANSVVFEIKKSNFKGLV